MSSLTQMHISRWISIRQISVARMTHLVGKCFLFDPYLRKMKIGLIVKPLSFVYLRYLHSNAFIRNARMKLAKNQVNAKQQPEAELFAIWNYSHFSSMLSFKTIGHILKTKQKNKHVCVLKILRLIIMKMRTKIKNRSFFHNVLRLFDVFYKIFLSPQVKRSVIITYNTSCLTSSQRT